MKKLMTSLLCLILLVSLLPAFSAAEEEEEELSLESRPEEAQGFSSEENVTWRTLGMKQTETLPVYSAPFDSAWRGAKGRAAVSTAEGFRLPGCAQSGDWLMVDYSVEAPGRRVGWICAPEGGGRGGAL